MNTHVDSLDIITKQLLDFFTLHRGVNNDLFSGLPVLRHVSDVLVHVQRCSVPSSAPQHQQLEMRSDMPENTPSALKWSYLDRFGPFSALFRPCPPAQVVDGTHGGSGDLVLVAELQGVDYA
jgi:hypothetical protein